MFSRYTTHGLVLFLLTGTAVSWAAPTVSLKPDGSIDIGHSRRLILGDSGVINIAADNGDKYEAFLALTRRVDNKWIGSMYLDDRMVTVDQAAKTTTFRGNLPIPGQEKPVPVEVSATALAEGRVRISVRYLTATPVKDLLSGAWLQFQSPRNQHAGEELVVGGRKSMLATDAPGANGGKSWYEGRELVPVTYFPGKDERQLVITPVQADSMIGVDNNRTPQPTVFERFQPKDNAIVFDITFGGSDKAASAETYGGVDYWAANKFRLPKYGVSRNLAQNSGFESDFHGWRFGRRGTLTNPRPGDVYEIDTTEPFAGRKSLKIRAQKGESPAHLDSFGIPVEMGGTYTLSFYAKTDGDPARVSFSSTTSVWPKFVSRDFTVNREWKRYDYTFQSPAEVMALDFGVDSPERDCNVWLDNVQLEKGALTDYIGKPVEAAVLTAGRGNWTEPGKPINARLELAGIPETAGTAAIKVTDFFGKTVHEENLPFKLGANGAASLALARARNLAPGMYLVETNLKAGDFVDRDFSRITIAPFANGTAPHKGIFAYGAESMVTANWARGLDFYKRTGMGSAIYFDPRPHAFMAEVARNGIVNVSSIFKGGHEAGARNLKDDYHCTEADLQMVEAYAYEKAKAYPEIHYWKLINEPGNAMSISLAEMKEFVKPLVAARRGIRRANPQAEVLSPDPSNLAPQNGIQWIDLFLEAGGKESCDLIAIHPYRPRPEEPDMDDDVATFLKMLDKHGYKGDIWFTEGMGNFSMNLPALGVDVHKALSQEGQSGGWRVGNLTYDIGYGERIAAAYAMRSWLVGLKYGDRVKQQVNWYYFANSNLDYDLTPGGEIFAPNTLTQLLGDSKFKQDLELGEGLRGYLFEDGKKRPVAALWSTDIRVDKGDAEGPLVDISSLPKGVEIINFVGAPVERTKDVRLNSYPLFFRGTAGGTETLAKTLGSLPMSSSTSRQLVPFVEVTGNRSAEIRLQNLLTRPAQGKVTVRQDGKTLLETAVNLAGKATWANPITLPFAAAKLTPEQLQVTFQPEGGARAQVSDLALETLAIPKAATPPTIDGDLGDWPAASALPLPRRVISFNKTIPYGGPKDLDGTLYTAWDAKNLYLAFKIQDDQLMPGPRSNAAWQGDGVQIYFDSFQNAGAATKPGFDSDDQNFDLWPSPDGLKVQRVLTPDVQLAFLKPGLVENAKTALKRTADGYIMELAIPAAELAPIAFKPGVSFGFSLILNDKDDEAAGRKRGITLTPEGTEPFQHPELFTTVVLGE